MEDTLGWAAVLIGAGIMMLWDVPIIDPLLSIGISLFILWNVLRNLRQFFDVFLQRAPKAFDLKDFEKRLLAILRVVSVHHTHSWSIDGENHVMTIHLVMKNGTSREDMIEAKSQVRGMLDSKTFEHVTVDVELEGEACIVGEASEPEDAHSNEHSHHHRY